MYLFLCIRAFWRCADTWAPLAPSWGRSLFRAVGGIAPRASFPISTTRRTQLAPIFLSFPNLVNGSFIVGLADRPLSVMQRVGTSRTAAKHLLMFPFHNGAV